ncbi:hypothetical protein BP6252_00130 [Coleophoma cylindrospora]|uniref:Uncharacterized protein n=1 Tax=Coleophoma cylindrospora TaxID=1849047 RepID=A0A3D8SQM6_9HELO|nr:hypothetical protein BP6252_00130 [Coleophoma cylindrospora]
MSTENETETTTDQTEVFRQLEDYPWDRDKEFQGGLSAILGDTTSAPQIHELTLRAQCFYFSRKKLSGAPIDFDAYKAYIAHRNVPIPSVSKTLDIPHHEADLPPAAEDPKSAPYPPTFSDIVALITSGAPIPGIKEIPPTVLKEQATKPVATKRRKPWESETAPLEQGGTFGDRRDEVIEQDIPDV